MKIAPDVDAYIEAAPEKEREKLKQLREIIRSVAPGAVERVSYGMPSYSYKGQLAYFSICKTHIGLYVPPPVVEEHKRELKGYKTAKATVRLPLDGKLPVALIRMLIKARRKRNEESGE